MSLYQHRTLVAFIEKITRRKSEAYMSNKLSFRILYEIKYFLTKYRREHVFDTNHFCKDISVKKNTLDANAYYLIVRGDYMR